MNAFARSNLSVALLRLAEAQTALATLQHRPRKTFEEVCELFKSVGAAEWSVREAMRLVENAAALDEMESVDTLPMPPESGSRRMG